MSIQAFISQPTDNSYHAAYRPVTIRVSATANFGGGFIPPVVYCDIYFDDVFYKTLSKTQYNKLNPSNSEWEFDLQDAAQEYLEKYLSPIAQSSIEEVTAILCKVFCRIRCSGINSDGFIEHDGEAPVQGTSSSDPVSGTGTLSNTFYIVNATLQHIDVQDLATHLNYYKQRTWASDVQPLTHRPEGYGLLPADSDMFPIIDSGNHQIRQLRLNYRNCNQTTFGQATIGAGNAPSCTAVISTPVVLHNVDGWLVAWSVLSGSPGKFFISTPAVSAGAPHETTALFYQLPELAEGSHVVTVRPLCFIEGAWYFGAEQTVTIEVTPCEELFLDPVPNLPDAVAGVEYDYSIEVSGSVPITISAITKPSWMTITAEGNFIHHTGTPEEGDAGTGIEVSYTLSNCEAAEIDIDQTIDVTVPTVTGTILFSNQVSGISMDSVGTPSTWFSIGSGSFPIANGGSASGNITDTFSGVFGINITKVGVTTGYLRLTINDVLENCLPVTASGSYQFDPVSIALSDEVEIILSTTPC